MEKLYADVRVLKVNKTVSFTGHWLISNLYSVVSGVRATVGGRWAQPINTIGSITAFKSRSQASVLSQILNLQHANHYLILSSTILAIQLNPFTPKIKISTLCTVLRTLPIILALRIWLQTKQHVYPQIYISSLLIIFLLEKTINILRRNFFFVSVLGVKGLYCFQFRLDLG